SPSLRNDCDLEILFGQPGYGQTDSFDRDRAFEDKIARNVFRVSYANRPRAAVFGRAQESSERVNVALNDVPAKPRRGRDGALQINERPGTKAAKRRTLQSLA